MDRLAARMLLLAALSLPLPACVADDTAGPSQPERPARTAQRRSSDPGSRYLEVEAPLGGLTAETPPVGRGGAAGVTAP
jgi:hypothetical protein